MFSITAHDMRSRRYIRLRGGYVRSQNCGTLILICCAVRHADQFPLQSMMCSFKIFITFIPSLPLLLLALPR
ncbi:hypothetical protein HD806DRAFT_517445 [Xylariaceae sp. AK1471]|nr:hypothetical protein HD806DRAFT_517445 [Xylariaceae sp. AK1471]